jgi:putative nucleotidyltransferase-like protein
MSSESELLLATLRRAETGTSASVHWEALLALADSHGVLSVFCKEYRGTLPESFRTRARSAWAHSAFLACELQSLLEQFCRSGLEVLPLKGPLLAQILYGSPGLRRSDDLDLLVRPHDFKRARALLLDLGFEPDDPEDDYHQTFQRRNTWVELHFSVAPPSSPAMDLHGSWERAQTIQFRGQPARSFAKPDLLIYLILHGVKHEFARLIWLFDLATALSGMDECELNQALTMSQRLGIEGALLTSCELARLSFCAELPPFMVEAIARKPAITQQAAAIWSNLLRFPASPQTTHQGAGLFLHLEQNARSRWAQRLRCFRLSQQDHLWAQHYRIHPRVMLLLRPLRLLATYGPEPVWRTLFPPHQ